MSKPNITLRTRNRPEPHGTVPGWSDEDIRDIHKEELDRGRGTFCIISEDSFEEPETDENHKYICAACSYYLQWTESKTYTCMNRKCQNYLSLKDLIHDPMLSKPASPMSLHEMLGGDESEVFVKGLNPDSIKNGEYDQQPEGRTIQYHDDMKRIATVHYPHGFPSGICLSQDLRQSGF